MKLASAVPALFAVVLAAGQARAQAPAGPEFVVNVSTNGVQRRPALASDSRGNFVAAWQSVHDGSGYSVFVQRFDAAGVRRGAEFRANTTTAGNQTDPDVAVDERGDFVVVWNHAADVMGQRFSALGTPLGAEFRVNTYLTGTQRDAVVASDAAGNFVVAWMSLGQDGSDYGVFARRFDAAGLPVSGEFRVNTITTGGQRRPDVAAMGDGGFVVVWSGPDAVGTGVFGRRYAPGGAPVGNEFALTTSGFGQSAPAVAAQGAADFVVAWTSYGQDGSHNAVVARRFASNGAPIGDEFVANTFTPNSQALPAVVSDELGNFVLAWESFLQDGSAEGVFGQRFDAAGGRRGAEFAVSSFTTLQQLEVALAGDAAGNFVAAWSSTGGQDGSEAVIGRRFQGLIPAAWLVDVTGNGVLELNETARVEPSWRNATAASQAFTGVFSDFIGPTPATYRLTDPLANYGTALPGVLRSCADASNCYAVTITAGGRPVQHWDTTVLETLGGASTAAAFLAKRWSLHVGDSFADVPRSSGFYRFVETLLHHGVTGGCTAADYCPASPTTREQMAVFVLAAREGAGYAPAACAPPNLFADVPETSPFCRWIEDLANRGVVGGCGGGNYCPGDPVTREQMAVFVLRTLDPAINPPACAPPNLFADVPETSLFCRWVEELANRQVVTGCGGGNYCPTAPVTREQMGVFLSATFGLALYGP